tara:strand:+ start:177 stop:506 length:330 start_codon:yes stop_codon:yes gene_type:complete
MASAGQKKKLLLDLAMYFAEKGEICTPAEFNKDKGNRPYMVKSSTVNKYFGSWSTMVKEVKQHHSDILSTMETKEVKKPFDPLAEYFDSQNIEAEPDPLEQLRASSKEK